MIRLAGMVFAAALFALQGTAMAGTLNPDQAIRTLIAHGIIGRFPAGDFSAGHPLSRSQMAELTAQAIARVEVSGASRADLSHIQGLMDALPAELDALGVRETNITAGQAALESRTRAAEKQFGTDLVQQPANAGSDTVLVGPLDAALLQRFIMQTQSRGPMQPSLQGLALGASPADAMVTHAGNVPAARVAFTLQRRAFVAFGSPAGVTYNRIFAAPSEPAGAAMVGDTVFGIGELASQPGRLDAHGMALSSRDSVALLSLGAASATGFEGSFPAGNTGLAGVSFRVHSVTAPSFEPGSLASISSAASAVRVPLKDAADFGVAPLTVLAPVSSFAYNPLGGNDAELSPSAFAPSQGLKADLSIPVRVGAFKAQGTFAALHLQELSPVTPFATSVRATEDQVTAGTKFDVHALGRPVSVNLSASYDRLLRNDRTAFLISNQAPAGSSLSNEQLTVPSAPADTTFNPNYIDVTRRTLGAAAAVPLTNDLSLNLQYKTQYYTGSYSALGQNVDGRKDSYLGNLTYTIPRTSSAIVFSAKQYRYHDIFVPNNFQTLNRADLNFTVKF